MWPWQSRWAGIASRMSPSLGEPVLFGPVASDPTVFRLIDTLAASGEKTLRAVRAARGEVRQRVRRLVDREAPDAGGTVTVDLDGVLVIADSD
jgi:hypothetical protein